MTGWSVAVPVAGRGAGLGNEAVPLAKAAIAAEVLGLELVEQPWFLNPRDYSDIVGRGYGNGIRHLRALTSRHRRDLPTQSLADVFDYRASMEVLASGGIPENVRLRHTSGLDGGMIAIASARPFLARRLLPQSEAPAPKVPGHITVGVHVRQGDFLPAPSSLQPGLVNTRLPAGWTVDAARRLAELLHQSGAVTVDFIVVTDDPDSSVTADVVEGLGAVAPTRVSTGGVQADLIALVNADVVVPSLSWFSTLALFLGGQGYVWPRDTLVRHGGWVSIDGHAKELLAGPVGAGLGAAARGELGEPRGIPWPQSRAAETEWASKVVGGVRDGWDPRADLVMSGVARLRD